MKTIKYSITFFSEWHAGSGLTSGSDLDALVIKDKNGMPYIPGRTLKGLLKEAAEELIRLNHCDEAFQRDVFGIPSEDLSKEADIEQNIPTLKGSCYFSNAILSDDLYKASIENNLSPFYYRAISSTAINSETGVAVKHSLRRIQTTIPCILEAEITGINEKYLNQIEACFKWIKRLGQNRNRGLGRCCFKLVNIEGGSK